MFIIFDEFMASRVDTEVRDGLGRALTASILLHNQDVIEFNTLVNSLIASNDDTKRFIDLMEVMIRDNLDWSFTTARYLMNTTEFIEFAVEKQDINIQ